MTSKILVVDDDPSVDDLLRSFLEPAYAIVFVTTGQAALDLLKRPGHGIALILLDILLPEISGYEICERIKADASSAAIPIIFLSALDKTDVKVGGFELGAVDYITKPFQADEVRARVRTHLALAQMKDELRARNAELEHRLRVATELVSQARERFVDAFQGNSQALEVLTRGIDAIADSAAPALLLSPGGCEEEAVARAIHHRATQNRRPFIRFDARGLDEDLPARLFGEDPPGKWELARDGTLFIEHPEALSPELQEELGERLHARRAGGGDEPRVILHSREDLCAEDGPRRVARRLYGPWMRLVIPSLAERRQDLPELIAALLSRFARRLGRPIYGLSHASMRLVQGYAWPGNFTELRNVLEYALLHSDGPVLEVSEHLLEGGRRLGSYELIERIGGGGMGEVWRARHGLLVRPAAVKLIRPDQIADTDQDARARFEREARVTAALQSPNTVRLYDFGITHDGALFYVMELLEGLDLRRLVKRLGALPPERAVYLAEQVCRSLIEAHGVGLVHRDLKPANIFLCRLGPERDVIKVLDFGLVRPSAEAEDRSTSQTGRVIGTPEVIAPEAVHCDEVDHRADIYALGCVLFWLVTGRRVFEHPTTIAQWVAHASEPPPRASQHSPRPLPPALDDLIASCLRKGPAERPQSVDELRRWLRAIRFDEPWDEERARDWWDENEERLGLQSAEETCDDWVAETQTG